MYEEASDKIGGRLVPFQALETVQMQSKEPQEAWKDKQGALVRRQEADGDRRGAGFVFFTTLVSLAPLPRCLDPPARERSKRPVYQIVTSCDVIDEIDV